LLAWYLTLRRWIGATSLAIGALLWPAILGLVTAWLLSAMSYYGSLAVIAGGGGLIALLLRQPWPGWSVVALTAGAVPALWCWYRAVGGCWVCSASQTARRWCSCLFSLA
jgi:hypothetical protein